MHLVFAIIKLSAISLQNPDALRVATELYKDCFDYAQKTNQVNTMNIYLFHSFFQMQNAEHDHFVCDAILKYIFYFMLNNCRWPE